VLRTPRATILHAGAVGVVAPDLAMDAGLVSQMLQFRTDLHIHLSVRSKATYFQLWWTVSGRPYASVSSTGVAGIVQLSSDVVVAEHLVDREDVERAVLERQAVGCGQALEKNLGLALAVLFGDCIDAGR